MKNTKLTLAAILLTAFTLFAFSNDQVSNIEDHEVPGLITAIGTAGGPNTFTFEKWKWTSFDMPEEKVENIKLSALIDCRSVTTDRKDLEKSVKKKKDYFNIADFPTATVVVDGAEMSKEEGKWETEALVTIKDITKQLTLTFTISDEAPYTVVGGGLIKRKKFGFNGGGPEPEVPVHFEATLPEKAFSGEGN